MLSQGSYSSSQGFPANSNSRTFGVSPNSSSGISAAGVASCGQEDALKAALTAAAKSNEQIDHDLLVKILSDPTIIGQLVRQQGSSMSMGSQPVLPKPLEGNIARPLSSGAPVYKMDPPPSQYNNAETGSSSSGMMSNGHLYPYLNGTGPMSMTHQQSVSLLSGVVPQVLSAQPPSHLKDLNYYKNLIQQHGGERHTDSQHPFITHPIHHGGVVDQDVVDNSKPRDAKHKIMKPCMYFNTSKGCRHGANCVYQHDMSAQQRVTSISEMQSAKRMKMDREIRGSQSYI